MTLYTGATVTTTPTIDSGASTTILSANVNRKFLLIQNNSAANVAINTEGAALSGIAPTSTNKCIVLPSSAGNNTLMFDPMYVPSGAITCYQTSGGQINTVTVVEG